MALGLTGGIGNLGAAAIQAVGLVVLATAGHRQPYWVCAVYLVLLAVVGVGAALFMDNLDHSIEVSHVRSVLSIPDTWAISFLYMCAAGSFIGFAFAFGQVLQHNLMAAGQSHAQAALHAAEIAFVGPLLGSIARVIGGRLGDRFDGGRVTMTALTAMITAAGFLVAVSTHDDLTRGPGEPVGSFTTIGYIVGFLALFIFCGVGKGSVFKLIPSVVAERSRALGISDAERRHWEAVRSGALIGLAGSVGALGSGDQSGPTAVLCHRRDGDPGVLGLSDLLRRRRDRDLGQICAAATGSGAARLGDARRAARQLVTASAKFSGCSISA